MRFEALASSSAGNAYIVSDSDTRILLECGIPYKQLQKLSGFALSELRACLVSHEHKDHAKSVNELITKLVLVFFHLTISRKHSYRWVHMLLCFRIYWFMTPHQMSFTCIE